VQSDLDFHPNLAIGSPCHASSFSVHLATHHVERLRVANALYLLSGFSTGRI
jgi:hypothetical protein